MESRAQMMRKSGNSLGVVSSSRTATRHVETHKLNARRSVALVSITWLTVDILRSSLKVKL